MILKRFLKMKRAQFGKASRELILDHSQGQKSRGFVWGKKKVISHQQWSNCGYFPLSREEIKSEYLFMGVYFLIAIASFLPCYFSTLVVKVVDIFFIMKLHM